MCMKAAYATYGFGFFKERNYCDFFHIKMMFRQSNQYVEKLCL